MKSLNAQRIEIGRIIEIGELAGNFFQITVIPERPKSRYNFTNGWLLDMIKVPLIVKSDIDHVSPFQSVLAHDLGYWDLFPPQVVQRKNIL